jgi:hypothetical protein
MVYLLLVSGVDISPWWLFVERDAGKLRHYAQHVGNLVDFLLDGWRGFPDASGCIHEFAHIAGCSLSDRRFIGATLILKQGFTDADLQASKVTERVFFPLAEAESAVIAGHDVSPLSLAASPAAVGVNVAALTLQAWRIQS